MHRLLPLALILLSLPTLFAQAPVNVGERSPAGSLYNYDDALSPFLNSFEETNVGFLHVYADPSIDPLETYLLRGNEMSDAGVALLPNKFRRLADRMDAKVYAASSVKGINNDIFMVRFDGKQRDQIDMFVIVNGSRIKHLKTVAYRDCANGECLQMDSYLTDVNLDTDLDLITIARRSTERAGVTDEKRAAYILNDRATKWRKTSLLDVPWDSIEFYEGGE